MSFASSANLDSQQTSTSLQQGSNEYSFEFDASGYFDWLENGDRNIWEDQKCILRTRSTTLVFSPEERLSEISHLAQSLVIPSLRMCIASQIGEDRRDYTALYFSKEKPKVRISFPPEAVSKASLFITDFLISESQVPDCSMYPHTTEYHVENVITWFNRMIYSDAQKHQIPAGCYEPFSPGCLGTIEIKGCEHSKSVGSADSLFQLQPIIKPFIRKNYRQLVGSLQSYKPRGSYYKKIRATIEKKLLEDNIYFPSIALQKQESCYRTVMKIDDLYKQLHLPDRAKPFPKGSTISNEPTTNPKNSYGQLIEIRDYLANLPTAECFETLPLQSQTNKPKTKKATRSEEKLSFQESSRADKFPKGCTFSIDIRKYMETCSKGKIFINTSTQAQLGFYTLKTVCRLSPNEREKWKQITGESVDSVSALIVPGVRVTNSSFNDKGLKNDITYILTEKNLDARIKIDSDKIADTTIRISNLAVCNSEINNEKMVLINTEEIPASFYAALMFRSREKVAADAGLSAGCYDQPTRSDVLVDFSPFIDELGCKDTPFTTTCSMSPPKIRDACWHSWGSVLSALGSDCYNKKIEEHFASLGLFQGPGDTVFHEKKKYYRTIMTLKDFYKMTTHSSEGAKPLFEGFIELDSNDSSEKAASESLEKAVFDLKNHLKYHPIYRYTEDSINANNSSSSENNSLERAHKRVRLEKQPK